MQSIKDQILNLKKYSTATQGAWFITGPKYPTLFILRWFNYLKKLNFEYHFVEDIQTLSCSFLGQGLCYWFGSLDQYTPKKKQEILEFLISYTGPHLVGVFIEEDFASKIVKKNNIVDLAFVQTEDNALYMPWLENNFKNKVSRSVFIDDAVLLNEYNFLLHDLFGQALKEWPINLNEEESLFNLSKYFFTKDSNKFFTLFDLLQKNYSTQFFISYLSDQIFRALFFSYYMQKNLVEEARSVSSKLPFYVTQNGWKKIKLNILQQKLISLYEVDFQLKNGGSEMLLEAWCLEYFL